MGRREFPRKNGRCTTRETLPGSRWNDNGYMDSVWLTWRRTYRTGQSGIEICITIAATPDDGKSLGIQKTYHPSVTSAIFEYLDFTLERKYL